jgi:hypothetical protein
MEAITRIAQIAKPMIVFTGFLPQDAHSAASSNYGAMAQDAIEGFLRRGCCQEVGRCDGQVRHSKCCGVSLKAHRTRV